MTGPERETLSIALQFLREWRDDDRTWKTATDERLKKLENRNVAQDAVAKKVVSAAAEAQLSRRWRFGIVSGIGAAALGTIVNLVLRLSGH